MWHRPWSSPLPPVTVGFLVGQAQHRQHRAPMLVEPGLAQTGFDALAHLIVAGRLRVGPDRPQRRTDDHMRDHQAQRDAGIAAQGRAHGGMAVQIDIAVQSAADLGPDGLVGRGDRFPTRRAPGLGAGHIALVEHDFAVGADIDIDAPALALCGLLIFPTVEALGRGDDDHIAPTRLEIGFAPFLDDRVLRRPESIGVGEIAIVAEQVGDQRALVALDIEQRMGRADRLPAKQPRLQLISGRNIGIGIVEQRQPGALLLACSHGQVANGGAVDLLLPIQVADARQEVAERQHAADGKIGKPEGFGDVCRLAAFLQFSGSDMPMLPCPGPCRTAERVPIIG